MRAEDQVTAALDAIDKERQLLDACPEKADIRGRMMELLEEYQDHVDSLPEPLPRPGGRDVAAGFELMCQGMRDDVLAEVKEAFKRGPAESNLDAYLYMSERITSGSQLVVRLSFEGEDVALLDIRKELLEVLSDDPVHYAGQIKAAALELRSLADEVLALLPDPDVVTRHEPKLTHGKDPQP